MDCRKMEILIQMDIDGRLPQEWQTALAAHISACPACAKANAELRKLDAILAEELPAVEVPADFAASVMASLPQEEEKPANNIIPLRRKKRWLAPAALTAAAAALVISAGAMGLFDAETPALPDDSIVIAEQDLPEMQPTPDDPQQGADPLQSEDDPADIPVTDPVEVTDPEGTEDPVTVTDPVEEDPADQPLQYIDGMAMPSVMTSTQAHGSYSQITLASYSDCDILSMRAGNGLVTYYIEYEGSYFEWQVPVSGGAAASAIGGVEGLPTTGGVGTPYQNETGSGYRAASPDGLYTADNRADGVWLSDGTAEQQVSTAGGGALVCWNSDNDKFFFTDAGGTLYVYYSSQSLLLTVQGSVPGAAWNGLNDLVFTAYDGATGHTSLFRVTLP